MRNFLLIIILIPTLAALAFDLYAFSQNTDKAFGLSDIGVIWEKTHKESHDQWRVKVQEAGEVIGALVPEPNQTAPEPEQKAPKAAYEESFMLTDHGNQETIIAPSPEEDVIIEKTENVQGFIGFLLKQKAVLVGLALMFAIYVLSALLAIISGRGGSTKMAKTKNSRKGGGYKYKRK